MREIISLSIRPGVRYPVWQFRVHFASLIADRNALLARQIESLLCGTIHTEFRKSRKNVDACAGTAALLSSLLLQLQLIAGHYL